MSEENDVRNTDEMSYPVDEETEEAGFPAIATLPRQEAGHVVDLDTVAPNLFNRFSMMPCDVCRVDGGRGGLARLRQH